MDFELSADVTESPVLAQAVRPSAELVRWTAVATTALVVLVAAVLSWRRVAGVLSNPPSLAVLLLVGTLVAAATAAARVAWSRDAQGEHAASRRGSVLWRRLIAASLSVAVLAAGLALSLPGTWAAGLAVFWVILTAEECWAWAPGRWRRFPGRRLRWTGVRKKVRSGSPPSSTAPAIPSVPRACDPPADEVTQQIVRSFTADRGEVLSGWLRVPMAAGQRSTSVHLAFCPPFGRTPKVKVEQLGGPVARIKATQVLPYGARFDLKLAASGETAQTLLLQFSAVSAPAGSDPESGASDRAAET
jgi:hypothetical protein